MRILLLTHAFNSLTQRLFVTLIEQDHQVSVEYDIHDQISEQAVELFQPDLIIAPFLKRAIPKTIWKNIPCWIVHPGIKGDRGPSALDWAILNQEPRWGVTILQANAEMDAGDVWATSEFSIRSATKSSLYRTEISDAAINAIELAIQRFVQGQFKPEKLDYNKADVAGQLRPAIKHSDRSIDWQRDNTETVLRKIRSADGFPGVIAKIFDRDIFLYDAVIARRLVGDAGTIIARSGPAVCIATRDGAIWVGHLKDNQLDHAFKLPASLVLGDAVAALPEIAPAQGYCDIYYQEQDNIGYLHFPFYNGAMSTEQCARLLDAYKQATSRDTRVIVLMGGPDFWSNGMNLNIIEAANSPADESWCNINAMNDLAEAIITTETHITVSALQGNAGAGGVFLARAADYVWARDTVILNPHYKDMGNLYGSEYWTYLLPRYAGQQHSETITEARLPMGVNEAKSLGLVNTIIKGNVEQFNQGICQQAKKIADDGQFFDYLKKKKLQRAQDEAERPLQAYRDEELQRMRKNFYGFDASYHVARYNFVYKICKSHTPLTLAVHRNQRFEYRQKERA